MHSCRPPGVQGIFRWGLFGAGCFPFLAATFAPDVARFAARCCVARAAAPLSTASGRKHRLARSRLVWPIYKDMSCEKRVLPLFVVFLSSWRFSDRNPSLRAHRRTNVGREWSKHRLARSRLVWPIGILFTRTAILAFRDYPRACSCPLLHHSASRCVVRVAVRLVEMSTHSVPSLTTARARPTCVGWCGSFNPRLLGFWVRQIQRGSSPELCRQNLHRFQMSQYSKSALKKAP